MGFGRDIISINKFDSIFLNGISIIYSSINMISFLDNYGYIIKLLRVELQTLYHLSCMGSFFSQPTRPMNHVAVNHFIQFRLFNWTGELNINYFVYIIRYLFDECKNIKLWTYDKPLFLKLNSVYICELRQNQ